MTGNLNCLLDKRKHYKKYISRTDSMLNPNILEHIMDISDNKITLKKCSNPLTLAPEFIIK